MLIGGLFGRPLQIPPNVASGDYLKRVYAAGNVKPYFDGVAPASVRRRRQGDGRRS